MAMHLSRFVSYSFPVYVLIISGLVYLFARILLSFIHQGKHSLALAFSLDQAEKGSLEQKGNMSDDQVFQLEKRAFFSKTWLFVCHESRFSRPGDYHAFEIAGISFFVVLGKDNKLCAFHNVCRHRAYTVVRKSCGNSTRFSCKYHGWQYDEKGTLVKAPKFDEFPGFVMEDNGLFAVKLITTREGLVFVNFDASTMRLPFNNVRSHVDLGSFSWVDEMEVTCGTNWKRIGERVSSLEVQELTEELANDFSNQAQWSQNRFGWFRAVRKSKVVRLLGPLSIIRELDDDLWCTMVLLPQSSSEVVARCDLYAKEGHVAPATTVEKWKWTLEQELANLSRSEAEAEEKNTISSKSFAYQCGGRTIDLHGILAQHQRAEQLARRKLQPAIRVTGTASIDTEAEALCSALDGVADTPSVERCSRTSSSPQTVEW